MAYHADFWMLAGATSPVVALAAIVSAALTLAVLPQGKRLGVRLIKIGAYFICLLNIALQVVVAQAALTSLARGHDFAAPHGTTNHVITGLCLLFVSLAGRIPAEAVRAHSVTAQNAARVTEPASTVDPQLAADVAGPAARPT
jgi:hypothetical protein